MVLFLRKKDFTAGLVNIFPRRLSGFLSIKECATPKCAAVGSVWAQWLIISTGTRPKVIRLNLVKVDFVNHPDAQLLLK